jgi:hypothetical protein
VTSEELDKCICYAWPIKYIVSITYFYTGIGNYVTAYNLSALDTNSTFRMSSFKIGRYKPACLAFEVENDTKIIVAGGGKYATDIEIEIEIINLVEIFSFETNLWTYADPMPFTGSYGTILNIKGRIFYFAGKETDLIGDNRMVEYNPIERKWMDIIDLEKLTGVKKQGHWTVVLSYEKEVRKS